MTRWRERHAITGSRDSPFLCGDRRARLIPTTTLYICRVPLDKDEGFVKAQSSCAVRLHRMNCREVEDQSSGRFTLHHQTVGYAPPTIDTATDCWP